MPRRVPGDHRIRRHVAPHQTPGGDHRSVPNARPGKDHGVLPDPHVITYDHVALAVRIARQICGFSKHQAERISSNVLGVMLASQQNLYAGSYGTIIADLQSRAGVVVNDLRAPISPDANMIIGVPFVLRHKVRPLFSQDFMEESAKQPFQHNSTPVFPTVSPFAQAAPDYSRPPARPFARPRSDPPSERN